MLNVADVYFNYQANTSPTNMHTKPHRQLMVSKCSARDCREPGRHCVKRRWLLKVKARIHSQVQLFSLQILLLQGYVRNIKFDSIRISMLHDITKIWKKISRIKHFKNIDFA